MKGKWLIVAGLLAVTITATYAKRETLLLKLFDRAADKAMARDVMVGLAPDKLHVFFCGTGSPLPNRDRAEACTAIIAGGRIFVFDAGEGAGKSLAMSGLPLSKAAGVWLTHLHSDHFEGLGGLMLQRWAGTSAATPLAVAGPIGTTSMTDGLNQAFRIDGGFRIAHHGGKIVPPSGFGLRGNDIKEPGVVFDDGGVRIAAFPVNHAPVSPAFGYRLDWQGLSVTLSGDTAESPDLLAAAKGTNLLVHEVLSDVLVKRLRAAATRAGQTGRAQIMSDIIGYHATPEQAGKAATTAGAKALALTHVVPAVPKLFSRFFTQPARTHYQGRLLLAHDGDLVTIDQDGVTLEANLLK